MKISLALGGGGSKGNAHIGVLKVLERSGHHIAALAGTSVGGLIGAIYLAGNSPELIEQRFSQSDFRNLFRRDGESNDSLLGLKGVERLLDEMLADRSFSDLAIPFVVTSVDLITGQEIVLNQGRLVDAILAAIALPGIFPSRKWGEYVLVDGGLINPVPVSIARSLAPGLPVIAVTLSRKPEANREIPKTSPLGVIPALDRISRFRLGQAFNVFTRSMSISGRLLTELRLSIEKPEYLIRPKVDHVGLLDQVDVPEIVKLGEEAALKLLPALNGSHSWLNRMFQRVNPRKWFSKADG